MTCGTTTRSSRAKLRWNISAFRPRGRSRARADGARELVDELARIHELERLDALAQELRRLVEQAEVGLDLLRGVGRCTLTATSRPSGSTARCTCPIDADGERREVELEERAVHAQVELRLDDLAHLLEGIGDASSWRPRSSATMSGGTTSGRVERSCPNLTNVGPSSSSIARRRRPRSEAVATSPFASPGTRSPMRFRRRK
jgi:hypothetical protein